MKTSSTYFFKLSLCLLFILLINLVQGQSMNGYISCVRDPNNPYKITATLTTYQPKTLTNPDNVEATLYWGDGTKSTEPRFRRSSLDENYFISIYKLEHTYASPGTYTIGFRWANRDLGIFNILEAHKHSFYISNQIKIDPILANNSTPTLVAAPPFWLPEINTNQKLTFNLAAQDTDGDSIAYQLVPALEDLVFQPYPVGTVIASYTIPNFVSINAKTGAFILENVPAPGVYNFALQIAEYRKKELISRTLVDFTSLLGYLENNLKLSFKVTDASDQPLANNHTISALLNQPITINVQVSDPNATQVSLDVFSELIRENNATFKTSSEGKTQSGTFTFTPLDGLKVDHPYRISFSGLSTNGFHSQYTSTDITIVIKPNTTTNVSNDKKIELKNPYPNPAENYIIIEHLQAKSGHLLTINDLTGKIIKKIPINNPAYTVIFRQDLMYSGQYFYFISDKSQIRQSGRFNFK